ncbi:protein kinase [Spirillospora sp. NPDC029432]|uniref:WD40 repeat domain-containing serine/threonine protein kinase n=1 Tax=Spirillospora sp. NPDC029432 TaxID=3154599 RepID=UPI0034565448
MVDRLEPGDPERIGEFWLAGRLGAGGQGVVYEAYGPDGGRVAVKVLHGASESPEELARMAAEARAAQRVASFCTARILRVHLEPPRPYIVSEYIDGLSLQAAVTGGGGREPRRFGGDDLHRLGIGIATALTAIHRARVVHRDLKPGNVMLGPDGPRLIDFGIARMLDTGSATRDGGLVGTLRYMPPEVYAGERAGAEADVFAWGAIMVFAATGRHAFTGADLPQIAHQVRTSDPDLSALPEPLRALVAAALSKDALRRPSAPQILAALTGDPREGADDLQNLVDRGAELAGPPSGWAPGDPALGKLAEDAYTALSPEERHLVPEVFLRCLVPGDDGGWSVRPVPAAELLDRREPAEGEALERVVRAFAPLLALTGEPAPAEVQDRTGEQALEETRVDAPDPDRVEEPAGRAAGRRVVLTRPAVLRAWPRLRDWTEDRHEDLAVHHRVRQAARIWDDNGRRRGDVLTGAHLDQAMGWATAGRRPFPNRTERGLLDASTRAQTARTRRTRTIALVLAATTLLSLTATGWAVQAQQSADLQRDNANRQRDAVLSSQLVAQSRQATDPAVSALLAAAAWRLQKGPESRAALATVLARPDRAALTVPTDSVDSVAYSPDGRTLATGGGAFDPRVQLWDVRARRQVGDLRTGHSQSVNSIAFSPDGRTLATGGGDSAVLLWDVHDRRRIGALSTDHMDGVHTVAFSPDGGTLATSGHDGTVRLWDARSRRPIGAALTGGTGLGPLAFSPDGRTLAAAGDGTVHLWDVATRRPAGAPLTGHSESVDSIAFSPDGRTLAVGGGDDGRVRLWDVRTRRPAGAPLTGHTAGVYAVAFSPDSRILATSDGTTVRMWDPLTSRPIGAPLTGHSGTINAVAFSPDGRTLATTGGDDKTVRLWNVRAHVQLARSLTVNAVAFSPDGRTLATGDDTLVRLWDTRGRQQTGALTGHTNTVNAVAFSPDGRTVATGGDDDTVRLWDLRTRRPIGAPLTGHDAGVDSVAFSPDGGTLAASGSGAAGKVLLWGVRTRRAIGRLHTDDTDTIGSVVFSPDGRTLATGDGVNGAVRLWDLRTRRAIGAPLTGHTGIVHSVVFSPDGRTLATGGEDKTVRLWDVRTRRAIGTPLTGHTDAVNSVAFSRDGRTLATGSTDRTVRLWDAGARRQIGEPLTGHTRSIYSVAFSPDGATLATGSEDETVRLWDVSMPADLAGSVCAVAGRTLTRREWAQYMPAGLEYRKICP